MTNTHTHTHTHTHNWPAPKARRIEVWSSSCKVSQDCLTAHPSPKWVTAPAPLTPLHSTTLDLKQTERGKWVDLGTQRWPSPRGSPGDSNCWHFLKWCPRSSPDFLMKPSPPILTGKPCGPHLPCRVVSPRVRAAEAGHTQETWETKGTWPQGRVDNSLLQWLSGLLRALHHGPQPKPCKCSGPTHSTPQ